MARLLHNNWVFSLLVHGNRLQCLLNMLSSLVAWSKDSTEDDKKEEDALVGEKDDDGPSGASSSSLEAAEESEEAPSSGQVDVVTSEEAIQASRALRSQADYFGKAKAHKSTMESAVQEVSPLNLETPSQPHCNPRRKWKMLSTTCIHKGVPQS